MKTYSLFFVLFVSLALTSCSWLGERVEEPPDQMALIPAAFGDLPEWEKDRHGDALATFLRSCARIQKRSPAERFGPDEIMGTYGDWQDLCQVAAQTPFTAAKPFFETYFIPYLATNRGQEETGLFTGYYEAALNGSYVRGGVYQTPLRGRPDDLVMVDLGEFRDSLKGQRIAGRVSEGRLRPYEDSEAIRAGVLPESKAPPLLWVDSPVDAFFLQIQGSGRVTLPDGDHVRVGYAGQNGHPYYAVGRSLVKRGILDKEDVSMQAIREWMETDPEAARDLMNENKSYVFFRLLGKDGPFGAEGIVLTPERSLAVDRSHTAYGIPVWLNAPHPIDGRDDINRLMIAQDTGGAIRGPVRGDFFWGHGPEAYELAGKMKSQGRMWLLLPKQAQDKGM